MSLVNCVDEPASDFISVLYNLPYRVLIEQYPRPLAQLLTPMAFHAVFFFAESLLEASDVSTNPGWSLSHSMTDTSCSSLRLSGGTFLRFMGGISLSVIVSQMWGSLHRVRSSRPSLEETCGGGVAFRVGGALSRPARPLCPFLIMEPLAMISSSKTAVVLRIAANAGAIYTIVTHRTGSSWISLVRIGSYWFVLIHTNSHHVRIASHRIRINSPSPPYCFVSHRIVIALQRIASCCILPVRVQFLLIRTYHRTTSY